MPCYDPAQCPEVVHGTGLGWAAVPRRAGHHGRRLDPAGRDPARHGDAGAARRPARESSRGSVADRMARRSAPTARSTCATTAVRGNGSRASRTCPADRRRTTAAARSSASTCAPARSRRSTTPATASRSTAPTIWSSTAQADSGLRRSVTSTARIAGSAPCTTRARTARGSCAGAAAPKAWSRPMVWACRRMSAGSMSRTA